MKTKTIIETDADEIDLLVQDNLEWEDADYDFRAVQLQGDSDGVSVSFTVTGELNSVEEGHIERWNSGEFVDYSNEAVMNYLCSLGIIEAGEYYVYCG